MLSFHEYWKINSRNLPNKVSAKRAYRKYVECEEEVMGTGCAPAKASITPTDFNKAKAALQTANVMNLSFVSSTPNVNWFSFDDVCQKQEGTTPMNTNSERDYLNRRVSEVLRGHDRDLVKQFHLDDITSPKTYKDLIDWIKNDKYEIDKKQAKNIDYTIEEDGRYYGSFLDGIIWTGCGFKVDREGYDVANKALYKARQEAMDVINVSDAAAGLKALQEFEAWTYEAPKSRKH